MSIREAVAEFLAVSPKDAGATLVVIGFSLAGCWVAISAVERLTRAFARWWLYRRSRCVAPAPGQLWRSGYGCYQIEVVEVDHGGRVHMTLAPYPPVGPLHSRLTWADSPDEWRERLRLRSMHLVPRDG